MNDREIKTKRAIVRIGNSLYTKMEASEEEIIYGFEYLLSDEDSYIRVQAF